MSDDSVFRGRVKTIQWNNRLLSGLLSLYFILSILFFVILLVLPIIVAMGIFDPDHFYETINGQNFITRLVRIFLKVFGFSLFGALYFVHKSIKDIPFFFQASRLNLRHDDLLYRSIETQCISRGLRVPDLYVLNPQDDGAARLVTAVVLRDLTGKSSVIFSEGALALPKEERESLIAQAIQRIHTKETLFLTFLCFFGFYPFHIKQEIGKIRYAILKPALYVTDLLLSPMRNWIINLRFSMLDVGSLELTKEKEKALKLLSTLSTSDEINKYFYEAYLPLFIAQSDPLYRLKTLRSA